MSDVSYALEVLAWCHALPRLSPAVGAMLLDHLFYAVTVAQTLRLQDQPLIHQLLGGELPLTLARSLPGLAAGHGLGSARRMLSAGLRELLDGQGLPHARYLDLLRPLLACWTRCRALGQQIPGGCWSEAAETQYQWLVRNALRLSRPDGSHVFSQDASSAWNPHLFQAALRLGGDEDDREIAARLLPRQPKRRKRTSALALPELTLHSEWAAMAVMHSEWSSSSERLTAAWPGQTVRLELAAGKELLWSGSWQWELRIDGRPIAPAGKWEEVCWFSDDEVDYLELEISLQGYGRLQRQVLFTREDRFVYLADLVLGRRRARIDYRACLPLWPGVRFHGAEETRDGFLRTRTRRALVLPLALPEWRCDVRVGELRQTPQGLELSQTAQGRRLAAPLFIDLDRRRLRGPTTWRQLSVGQSLENQPPEVAVGFRVMIGDEQWLLYRSLAKKANRTLLGHNLSTEMLVARFEESGEIDSLVEIE